MDVQESVIVIIKDQNKLLLQKNRQWKDLSFIGGKAEQEDANQPLTTAYREVEEELGIVKQVDFTLSPIEPKLLEFRKFSKRIQKERDYRIFPFLMKFRGEKDKLTSEENIWVSLENIEAYNNAELPLSDLVKEILPTIQLVGKDSFQ
ncbi:MAG: NUDIX domain-containing protein [Spirochaetota bacterium]